MAVSEYKPRNVYGCRYAYDQLENAVYLVSKTHVKDVIIDNGEAYISGLTETPLRFDVLNLQFSEESSLDERYKFTKQVTFSVNGYVPFSNINEKYYVILKSKDGTFWMVNVDFPSKVTYIFVLNDSQYQTDFTFSSLSNFPTLRLVTNIGDGNNICKSYRANGIDSLELLETDYCRYESDAQIMHTYGKDFVGVDYNKRSLSLQETFDGENTTTTIEFNIGFDAYKSSWHYNLLEFLQNHYYAIIKPKQGDEYFLSGFHFGLEPSFKVATTSDNGQSDIITVTLTETSLRGSYLTSNWTEQEETDTRWVYVKYVDNIQGWECVGMNQARYLLQQEVNQLGSPTGRYKSYQGHSFPTLNIVGSFTTDERFQETSCTEDICQINTTIPTSITYRSATCNTYTLSASCDWSVSGLANYMSVSPSSGNANSAYTVSVCNSKTPTSNESSTFTITAGNNTRIVNVNLTTDASILNPSVANINCLAQNVSFNYNPSCPITVTNIDSRLSYNITNSQLIVSVPRNNSIANYVTWNVSVRDCNNHTQTAQIIQDKTYERWVTVDGYICSGTTSYTRQQRYTGTTSSNINTPTSEYRGGSVIQTGDTRCGSVYTRWTRNTSAYTCVDGDKWSFDEEEVSTDGTNWTKNGNTRLAEMVESASTFCTSAVTYEWRITDRWQCDNNNVKFQSIYDDNSMSIIECSSSTTLTSSDTHPSGYTYSSMTNAYIGSCVKNIDSRVFQNAPPTVGCPSFTSITIPNSVTTFGEAVFHNNTILKNAVIGNGATHVGNRMFYGCTSLSSVTIGNSVSSIDYEAFDGCVSLSSITIPDSVTTINMAAFDSSGLKSVYIPNSVTTMDREAFYRCSGLTSVVVGNGLTEIGVQSFDRCTSLTSVTLGNNITNVRAYAFRRCTSLPSITIPNSVTEIGDEVFSGCTDLTNVSIGNGITSIGKGAFRGCQSLSSFTCSATTPPALGINAFVDTNNTFIIYVPSASVNSYKTASNWAAFADRIQAIT